MTKETFASQLPFQPDPLPTKGIFKRTEIGPVYKVESDGREYNALSIQEGVSPPKKGDRVGLRIILSEDGHGHQLQIIGNLEQRGSNVFNV